MLKRDFGFGGYIPDILSVPSVSFPPAEDSTGMDDSTGMALAIRQSMLAVGTSAPNPAVGCVVVKNGQILGQGHTQEPGGNHAEVEAFRQLNRAGFDGWPDGATVYVTLEPCSHFGRTPPCAELFRGARNIRVVIGCKDPNPRVSGEGIAKLRSFGLTVDCGVMDTEIEFTLLPFFRAMNALTSTAEQTFTRPFIGLKWAQSIDGKMADHHARSQWLTGPQTQFYSHWLRQKYDAIAVGFETLVQDRPRLSVRMIHPAVKPKHPVRICLDPRGKFLQLTAEQQNELLSHAEVTDEQHRWIVFCGNVGAQTERGQAAGGASRNTASVVHLRERESAAMIFQVQKTNGLTEGMEEFLQITTRYMATAEFEHHCGRPIQSLMIEGGPRILQQFLRTGTFDICHGLIAPLFLGSSTYGLINSESVSLQEADRLLLMQSIGSGDDVICEWSNPATNHK